MVPASKELERHKRRYECLVEALGFDYFAICSIRPDEFLSVTGMPRNFLTNFPEGWLDHYVRNEYYYQDPILKAAIHSSYAMEWRHFKENSALRSAERKILQEAEHFGIKTGVGLGSRNLHGTVQVVSLAAKFEKKFTKRELENITLHCHRIALDYSSITDPDEPADLPQLTDRERECLTWAGLGKSSAEAAAIMNISSNTVDFHIKSAMVKLDANSRVLAIVKALRLGVISL